MFIRRAFFLFCIPLILMGFASAHAQATDERLAQFEQIIQDEMAYYNIPGTAVAIIEGDEVIYAQGFGYRNVEDQLPFTTETRFRVGSTTKSMTSLLIAQLVDDGLLAWDTPVTDILPDFALSDSELTAQITVADLMGMATGLVSNTFDAFDWWEWEIDSLLDAVATQTINGEFRASHNYNNEVYALAGYVGAVASGLEPTLTSYQSLMQTRLFDPIGMASAIIADDHSQLGDNYAEPYEPDVLSEAGTVSRMIDAPIALVAPAGGVWVNIEDMAKYVITQMNGGVTPDGARIVSAENLAVTWAPGASLGLDDVPGYEDARYGMGWLLNTYRDIPMRQHNGAWSGYTTQMTIFPDNHTAILVFSNSSLGGQLNDTLAFTFAELWNGLDLQAAAQRRAEFAPLIAQLDQVRELAESTIDADTAAPLVGAYQAGWSVEYRDDSTLWLTNGVWAFRLVYFPVLGQYLVVNNGALGATVDFNTINEPTSLAINVGGTEAYTLEKVE